MNKLVELKLNGKIVRYTPEELSIILDSKFSGKPIRLPGTFKRLTVFPMEITPCKFYKARTDAQQESARCKIEYALRTLESNPEKYGIPFELFIPINHESKPIRKLKVQCSEKLHCELTYSTEVDEFLKWAFLIQNEFMSWEELCNEPDNELYPRIILKNNNGYFNIFGGGRMVGNTSSAASIDYRPFYFSNAHPITGAVPQFKRYLSSY